MINFESFFSEEETTKNNKNKFEIICEIDINIAQILEQQIGIPLLDYKFSIDFYSIRHILNRHGDEEIENLLGQIAVKHSDFEILDEILSNPDSFCHEGKNNSGKEVFLFQKEINHNYKIFLELRTGRKHLALNTMRIIKKNSQK